MGHDGGEESGWSIYADMMMPAPTLPPTPSPTSHVVMSDGECNVVGDGVHAQIVLQIMGQIWHLRFVSEETAHFL